MSTEDPPQPSPPPSPSPPAKDADNVSETVELRDNRKKRNMLVIGTIAIVVVAAILIGVLVPQDNNGATASRAATNPSTMDEAQVDPCSSQVEAPGDTNGDTGGGTNAPNDFLNDTEVNPPNTTTTYTSFGPLDVEIPLYSPDDLSVYADDEEAKIGFRAAALFLINNVVNRNLGVTGFQGVGFGNNIGLGVVGDDVALDAPVLAPGLIQGGADLRPEDGSSAATAGGGDQVGNEIDDFETNNQENNVDQADEAKSDGKFIYAAFGDHLLVIQVDTKKLVMKVQMPEIQCNENVFEPPGPPVFGEFPITDPAVDPELGEDAEPVVTEPASATRSSVPYPFSFCQQPKIESILLSDSRIGLIVSGYGNQYRQEAGPVVLNDFLSTHVRLYSTENLVDDTLEDEKRLKLLGVQDLNGYHQKSFVIKDVAYIASMSSLNTWYWLVQPSERWNIAKQYLSDGEYVEAIQTRSAELVEKYVSQMSAELSFTTGSLPNVANLNLPVDGASGVDGFENIVFGEGYANSMVQLTSFAMKNVLLVTPDTTESNLSELQVEVTCKFLSTSWGHVYAAEEMLIVAGQGAHFDPVLRASEEMTYLSGFRLDGISTIPAINGKVPGHLLNPYSIDFVGGLVRVATTIQNRWFIDVLFPRPISMEPVLVTERAFGDSVESLPRNNDGTKNNDVGEANDNATYSSVPSPVDPVQPEAAFEGDFVFLLNCSELDTEDSCFDEESLETCTDFLKAGCETIFYSSGTCPFNLGCLDRYEESQCPIPSSSDNCLNGKNFADCLLLERANCDIAILESCPYQFSCEDFGPEESKCAEVDDTCMSERSRKDCLSLEARGCDEISSSDCPFEFVCEDGDTEVIETPPEPLVSRTKNQVFVLKPTNDGKLEIVGNVTLGKPNEVFTSIRFFDSIAYAVTFEQRDPFYAIGFKDPHTPTVLGELDVTGFSRYMHSINDANTLILGVGQEADNVTGRVLGVQLSIFDANLPAYPKLVDRYVVEDGNNQWSTSSVEYDFQAFRYLKLGRERGRIILPLKYSAADGSYFDGFTIFGVNSTAIFPLFDIQHSQDEDLCYYCASLSERSFVIDGNVITLKGKSTRSHDLDTGTFLWGLDFA